MLSQNRLTNPSKAATAILLTLVGMSGCQHTPPPQSPPQPPKVVFSESHDLKIKEIMDLARQERWEEAQTKANLLFQQDPKNPIVMRVHVWVDQQAQLRRSQALEDKIREIDAKNSVFNPTFKSLLTEQKDRGLPPRKDVRDAIDHIENTPYFPETYGTTVHAQAPLFDFESAKGRMVKALEKEVTVQLDNVPLETLLVRLGNDAGVNIVADKSLPALKQILTVHLEKVKLSEFFRYISRNYDLQFQTGPDLVWVVDGKDPKHIMQETRFYRLRKGFILPAQFGAKDLTHTVTKDPKQTNVVDTTSLQSFVNDQAPEMPSLEKAIKDLVVAGTNGLKYMIDFERNLVMARGTPEDLEMLERVIREFDQPVQQVLIEARFVTVSKPAFMQLGVLWETGRSAQQTGLPQDFTGIVDSQNFPQTIAVGGAATPAVGIGIQETFAKVFGAGDLSATISALEQSGESQTLSAPRLTVLNNRPSRISNGLVQYYYEEYQVLPIVQQYYTSSSFVPSGKPTQIVAGAELNVLASISGDGKSILLALNPRVNTDVQLVNYATLSQLNTSGQVQSEFNISLPQYRTEELSTRMVVKSGETVVMGGVLERERSTYVESVPVLGDLPLVGILFRRRTEVDTPRYLLIFVTATIVKDTGEFLVYDEAGISPSSLTINPFPTSPPPVNPLPTGEPPASLTRPILVLSNAPPAGLPPANPASTNAPPAMVPPTGPASTNAPPAKAPPAGPAPTNAPPAKAPPAGPAPTNAVPASPATPGTNALGQPK
ncbi:MAG: type II secretion system protein GspD [Limisphaerales bacterium]